MDNEDREIYDSDDCYPSTLKPYWSRRCCQRREHEMDILLALIFGAALMALLIWKFLK